MITDNLADPLHLWLLICAYNSCFSVCDSSFTLQFFSCFCDSCFAFAIFVLPSQFRFRLRSSGFAFFLQSRFLFCVCNICFAFADLVLYLRFVCCLCSSCLVFVFTCLQVLFRICDSCSFLVSCLCENTDYSINYIYSHRSTLWWIACLVAKWIRLCFIVYAHIH